jgi:hypothetical protein
MIKIINGRLIYFGAYGYMFRDISDDYLKFILKGKKIT